MNINPASPLQSQSASVQPAESIATSPSFGAPPHPPAHASAAQSGTLSSTGDASARRLRAALPALVEAHLPLHEAITCGDYRAVIDYLDAGVDPGQTNANGVTPLMLAVLAGDHDIIEKLLDYGADTRSRDGSGNTVLHLAVTRGDLATLAVLIETAGPDLDINATARRNMTPLHLATQAGDREKIDVLVGSGRVRPNLRNFDGKAALHTAAEAGAVNLVETLMQVPGIDLNCRSVTGSTPLMHAAAGNTQNHYNAVHTLLMAPQINVNLRDERGHSALHQAVYCNDVATTVELLTHPGIEPEAAYPMLVSPGLIRDEVLPAYRAARGVPVSVTDAEFLEIERVRRDAARIAQQ
ncbi:ankyrin repeat domain-containing protein [Actimicrobium sp. CCC2.4]|uniref:ankyrin repeat domain-containing protein n=1 Tax=Actimicrobium sp. CCC2.4 TaxID=3048606 RepID=UPI002AC948DE|nr:ankyrin repeat domain-containing protein [Actimicrobium sp. CCC2.4]MEB0134315.1 ankyrin repeat domain-containing protein [Actimicrobium sp. CCC2.4]WPX32958.1 ankyrin repeat domain-containing protein [Actimicrobium sp. CCC2.4]